MRTAASCCLTLGCGDRALQPLDVGSDVDGRMPASARPRRSHQARKTHAGAGVGAARVRVADVGDEELT